MYQRLKLNLFKLKQRALHELKGQIDYLILQIHLLFLDYFKNIYRYIPDGIFKNQDNFHF